MTCLGLIYIFQIIILKLVLKTSAYLSRESLPCFGGKKPLHSRIYLILYLSTVESLNWMFPAFRSERARWITALGHSSGKQPPDRTCKYPEG